MSEAEQYPMQIPMPSMPYMSPQTQDGNLFEKLTNPEVMLDQMQLNFKNVEVDKEGNLKSLGEPLANDRGINFVIGQSRSAISQTTILSNLPEDTIYHMGRYLSVSLLRTLMVSRQDFGMKTQSARSTLFSTAIITSLTCMRRAEPEGLSDKKLIRGGVQELHTNITSQQGKKGGFLSNLWKH